MDADHQTETGRIGRQMQLYRERIVSLHCRGYAVTEIAFSLEIAAAAVQLVIDDWSGLPGPNDPTPEEIAERCRQIRSGDVVIVSGHHGERPTLRTDGTMRTRATRVAGLRCLE